MSALKPFLYGYNINSGAIRDYPLMLAHLRQLRSAAHVVMSEGGYTGGGHIRAARQLCEELNGESIIIWRHFSSYEGEEYLRISPEDLHRFWLNQYVNYVPRSLWGKIWAYDTNEPSMADPARWVAWTLKAMRLNHEAGLTAVFGNFGTGRPPENWVREGRFDEVIAAAKQYKQKLAFHEYGLGHPEAGMGHFPYNTVLSRPLIDIRQATHPLPLRQGYPLIRRTDEWLIRGQQIGVPLDEVYITEALIDLIDDANTQASGKVLDALRAKGYGIAAYNNDMRGVLTWQKWFEATYPNQPWQDSAVLMLKHAMEKLYHLPQYKAVTLFAWNSLWYKPQGTDFSAPEMAKFRNSLEELAIEWRRNQEDETKPVPPVILPTMPQIPATDSGWRWATLKSLPDGKGRIRSGAGLGFPIQATIGLTTVAANADFVREADGYDWLPIRFPYGSEKTSWIALEVLRPVEWGEYLYKEETPEPEPEPLPEEGLDLTPQQILYLFVVLILLLTGIAVLAQSGAFQ
jgi:hypothetical protein